MNARRIAVFNLLSALYPDDFTAIVTYMKLLLIKLGIHDKKSMNSLFRQFIKFGVVGVSNTLIFLAVYYALIYFNIHYIAANIAGFIIGTSNAYYWNSRYVFKQGKHSTRAVIKVFVSYGMTLVLSIAMMYCMVDVLGISEWIAPLINLCITVPLNFMLNKFWAFR